MEHLKDIELIEISAGRVNPRAMQRMRSHLDRCPDCSHRLRQITAVDDALDDWRTVAGAPPGLVSEVLRAAHRESTHASWGGVLRLAASVAISVSLGHLAARSFRDASPPVSISAAEVEDSLQLAALSQATPVGLTDLFLNGAEPQEVTP